MWKKKTALGTSLKRGNTKSCGCLHQITVIKRNRANSQKDIVYKLDCYGKFYSAYFVKKICNKKNADINLFDLDIEDLDNTSNPIDLIKNPNFIFDQQFYNDVSRYSWCRNKNSNQLFAIINNKTTSLQRYLLSLVYAEATKDNTIKVTFKSEPNYNFRIDNLLFVKNGVLLNRSNFKDTKTYRGVSKRYNKFVAKISKDNKYYHIGSYKTIEEAAKAYNEKAKELFGKYAYQNKVK